MYGDFQQIADEFSAFDELAVDTGGISFQDSGMLLARSTLMVPVVAH
jgi:hypothetical protein